MSLEKILGYYITDDAQSFDKNLEYVQVSCYFYFKRGLTDSVVSELKTKLHNILKADIDNRGFDGIYPHQVSKTIDRGMKWITFILI